ncbi:O-antigen polymerase [Shimazuella kribbensis]|uniref:O-antigen polymerase n=1 Tax=Shimazuella kribbensis TaxID=139808 RepID=UPI00041DB2C7|nr:O-antigen polymerase [Shimazuella kribbensis]
MIWILVWILTLIIGVTLLHKSSGGLSFNKPNLHLVIFGYVYLISSLIGSLLIVLEIDRSYIINKLMFPESRQLGFLLVCGSFLLFAFTTVIVSKIVGFKPDLEFNRYWHAPVNEVFSSEKNKKLFFRIFLGLSVVSLLSIIYTLLHTSTIPLFSAILGNTADLAKGRIDAKEGYTGIVYVKNILAIGLTPLLSIISFAYALKTHRWAWRVLFGFLFVGAMIIQLYNFEKAPAMFYMIMLVLTSIFVGKLKLNLRIVLLFTAIGVAYIVVMYTLLGATGSSTFLNYSQGPIGRIILTQIAPMYIFVDRFGEVYPFLHLYGLPESILKLYDVDQMRGARVIMMDLFPDKVQEGTAGVLNTLYVGEAYATYGVWSVVFASVYLGVFVQLLYILFIRLPKHPIFISLFVYFIISVPRAMVGGFSDLVINPIWIILFTMTVLPYAIVRLKETWPKSIKKMNKSS